MFVPDQMVRAHIREMPPYEPILPFDALSRKLGMPEEKIIKLDANENPYGPVPQVKMALAELAYPHIYPDPESHELRQALSKYHDIPFQNLVAGAGADELIDLLMRILIEPGEALINCPPTFGMYAFDGDINRARVITIPRSPDFSLEIQAIESAVNLHNPKTIFLASPNNPDGSLISPDHLDRLLALPVLVILDEAYIEFAAAGSSRIKNVLEYDNLVVLRTFSKWAGLAGLRVGYGIVPTWLAPHLWKVKQPYNVSVAASKAAQISLENASQLEEVGAKIITDRERLFELLSGIPWLKPYPSQANFILMQVIGRNAADFKDRLEKAGILVRYFNKPGLDDHIRISVGKPKDTDSLIRLIKQME